MSEEFPTEEAKNAKEFFRRHRIAKAASEFVIKNVTKAHTLMTEGRQGLEDLDVPGGLLEGSILASRLCFPDKEIGALIFKQAAAGQVLAYDFRRPEFPFNDPEENEQAKEGVLWSVVPDELVPVPSHQKTPNDYLNFYSLEHLLSIDKRPAHVLEEMGVLERVSHETAYEHVGQTQWVDELRSKGVANDDVYQVTPKGNTLSALFPEEGEKTPKVSPKLHLAWAHGH